MIDKLDQMKDNRIQTLGQKTFKFIIPKIIGQTEK